MAQPAVMRERLFALRETIAKLEGKPAPALAAAESEALADKGRSAKNESVLRLPLGIPTLDEAIDGGLPLDGITEVRSDLLREAGAGSGFVLALAAMLQCQVEESHSAPPPILWIADMVSTMEAGVPYAVGLRDFGLKPDQFFYASPRKLED
ncbi:MAG: hypothetical protein AAAC50_23320, partial [Rhizobium altiplani]